MIAVKWEFEGTGAEVAAAQMVVEKNLARYQRALRNVWCPVHGSAAALIVRGRTLAELELGIEPCCQAFIDEAYARVHRRKGQQGVVLPFDRSTPPTTAERRRAVRRRSRLGDAGRRTA
jgi:hypothetical protein